MTTARDRDPEIQQARLGAHALSSGTRFAVEAPHATAVELCLFSEGMAREYRRVAMQRASDGLRFVTFVPDVGPGALYGYRAYGLYAPDEGLWFNPHKLLVDPWARHLSGPLGFHCSQRTVGADGNADLQDSAAAMLRSVVVDDAPMQELVAKAPARPSIALGDTLLYECHVRGVTQRHPEVPADLRGTYLGLCHPAIIEHVQALSVTTLSLLPVAEFYDEEHLLEKGLRNYWGYAPLACFAPTRRYARDGGDPRIEFRKMVDEFHRAGIEVIVDVVFNHTAEADEHGTTLSHRGLHNRAIYALAEDHPRRGLDHTGCGNSLDLCQPTCLRFVMDALRYWVTELGVDGFRFDLAVTLGRRPTGFDSSSPFLAAITQDPVLRGCKLIAEPWDRGTGGYRLGGFPPPFSEWNDRFRDGVRRFFRGEAGRTTELATRLSGSSDLFRHVGRGPQASINFVTSHDGFTLRDLVSYAFKHNEANGEHNRDGTDENFSHNFGCEGPSVRSDIEHARQTCARAMLLSMAAAQGTPMLCAGDEMGRTQEGNNNTYCHDGPLSYLDWRGPWREELLPFFRDAFSVRKRHPCLRAARHMHGDVVDGRPDIAWLRADGEPMKLNDWKGQQLGMRVCGKLGDGVLLIVNGSELPARFRLPQADLDYGWRICLDAARVRIQEPELHRAITLAGHSAALFEMRSLT